MPAAFASARAGFRASGSFGLKHDRVDVLGDQVAEVSELAGRVHVVMDRRELRHLARGQGLSLGRADLLLAEAVADAAGVRIADRELLAACEAPQPAGADADADAAAPRTRRSADAPPGGAGGCDHHDDRQSCRIGDWVGLWITGLLLCERRADLVAPDN